jgi:hypothetical protein
MCSVNSFFIRESSAASAVWIAVGRGSVFGDVVVSGEVFGVEVGGVIVSGNIVSGGV